MSYKPDGEVEDYTDAFLASLWVLLVMAFWTIAILLGFAWVALTAWGLARLIDRIGRARGGLDA